MTPGAPAQPAGTCSSCTCFPHTCPAAAPTHLSRLSLASVTPRRHPLLLQSHLQLLHSAPLGKVSPPAQSSPDYRYRQQGLVGGETVTRPGFPLLPPRWTSPADPVFIQPHPTGLWENAQASNRIPAEKVSLLTLIPLKTIPSGPQPVCVGPSGRNIAHFLPSLLQGGQGPLRTLQRRGSRFHDAEPIPFLPCTSTSDSVNG